MGWIVRRLLELSAQDEIASLEKPNTILKLKN
jgi:hypothetical protein